MNENIGLKSHDSCFGHTSTTLMQHNRVMEPISVSLTHKQQPSDQAAVYNIHTHIILYLYKTWMCLPVSGHAEILLSTFVIFVTTTQELVRMKTVHGTHHCILSTVFLKRMLLLNFLKALY